MTSTWEHPPHSHSTIADAGTCQECRAWTIGVLKDAPYAFVLAFPPRDGAPLAVALVKDWSQECSDAADTAWATGCNLPRGVMVAEIPLGVAVESGVEMFRVHEGGDAADAWRVLERMLVGDAS